MIRTLLVLAALARPALADPSPKDQAKVHFKQGRAMQNRGDHSGAAHEYEAAYELDHRPEMLFNIAQAYRLAGDKRPALDYYQRYLADQPTGAGAVEARQHVAALTKQLEAEAPPPVQPPPIEPAPPTAPGLTQPEPPAPPPPPPPAPEERRSSTLQIAGLATAGVGAIAIGAGIKLGLDARSAADDISGHAGPWTDADQHRFDDGERANRRAVIAYTAGGALVATGAVLFVLGRRTHVVPLAGGDATGAMVWGRF